MFAATVRSYATEATLTADAHVNSARPAANSGAISNLYVGNGYTALLQFDLSTLPAGTTAAQVTKAVLRLYCNRVDTAGLVSVAAVNGAWGEYSLTYGTLPALGSAAQVFSVSQAGAFVTVDVTAVVQGWMQTGATNNGLALTAGTAGVQFDSKENDLTAHGATLDIALASPGATGAAGPAGAQGPAGATGAAGAKGVAGAAGAPGPAGPSGPAGAQGPAGATGAVGAAGPAGAKGSPGLGYVGVYQSTMNYGLADVVGYLGSSYISLIASNHGNTPSLSPAQWGVLVQAQAGPAGPAGAAGVPGATGATGVQGAIGLTGAPGATGATGSQGLPGLTYQGSYASATNYKVGDVVFWSGAAYASLTAANLGNTPDARPGQWGLISAQGATGVAGSQGAQGIAGPQGLPGSVGPAGERGQQGSQGIPGQAGAQGLPGVAGGQGLQGPVGAQGPAGPTGMSFRGTYSSAMSYSVGDGVTYGGAAYVSLVMGNVGKTPDQSPGQWGMFAAAGGPGATGATGATGAQGAQGVAGAQGLQGVPGPTGATGPQGLAAANYTGNYSSIANYGLNDAVSYAGSTYVSMISGNRGNVPDQSAQQWALLVQRGAAGAAGATGATGATGAAGPAGATGAIGPQGPPVSFQGGWSIGRAYAVGDAVSYGGSSYIAGGANSGRQPDVSPLYWGLLAQVGATGAAGPQGSTGATGAPGIGAQGPAGPQGATGLAGPSGPVGATGASGAAGPAGPVGAAGAAGMAYRGSYLSATTYGLRDAVSLGASTYISTVASNVGNSPDVSPTVWSVLAAGGANGAPGAMGPAGRVGMVFRGPWNSATYYQTGDAAVFGGTTYLAQMSSSASEPDLFPAAWQVLAQQGSAGATGPSGAAATVQVGTVTTGAAGSVATVTNVGTAAAAVLNFSIPQGAAGANGTGSGGAAGGLSFQAMYHAASAAFPYYSVSNATAVSSEGGGATGAAVLTWVPAGCTATKLSMYTQQGNTITATLRQGMPGSMANTSLGCTASSNTSCTGTGGVVVAPGSFVDITITGANGTAAPVWTALACE